MLKNAGLPQFFIAAIGYTVFAVWLFVPSVSLLTFQTGIITLNTICAATGCYYLSRRWTNLFLCSFLSGITFGFGMFMLSLTKFHPAAGTAVAIASWSFVPAVFWPRNRFRFLGQIFWALPFVVVIVFFHIVSRFGLFPLPIQIRFDISDLSGLILPLTLASKKSIFIGFYHVPLAAMLLGLVMFIKARRLGFLLLLAGTIVLAFSQPVFFVSPVIWLSIVTLCLSIMIATGTEALLTSGKSDGTWLLITTIATAVISMTCLLLAAKYFGFFAHLADSYANLMVFEAKMHMLTFISCSIILIIARSQSKLKWLRYILIIAACAVDILASSAIIISKCL